MESTLSNPSALIELFLQVVSVGGFLTYLLWREHKIYFLTKEGMKGEAIITKIKKAETQNGGYSKLFYEGRASTGEPFKGSDILTKDSLYERYEEGDRIAILYDRLNHKKNMPAIVIYDKPQHWFRRFLMVAMLLIAWQILRVHYN